MSEADQKRDCPYCVMRDAKSRDHVFPDFLGGKETIFACKRCNDTFGHSFEGRASTIFESWFLLMRMYGIQPPRPMVWRRVKLEGYEEPVDISSDLQLTPSDPTIERDKNGRIAQVRGSKPHIDAISKSLVSQGYMIRGAPAKTNQSIEMSSPSLSYVVTDDLKRLCVKMSVAALTHAGQSAPLSMSTRDYLQTGRIPAGSPVRISVDTYTGFESLRHPLSHAVYARLHGPERRAFSVVQFFGGIQFYCDLARDTELPDSAVMAMHDSVSHAEQIAPAPLFDYPIPPRFMVEGQGSGMQTFYNKLLRELKTVCGDRGPVSFTAGLASPNSILSTRKSSTVVVGFKKK